ncbi:MAG: glycosyltransferase family 2 protein [Armatimonadetes bacterium]|nr:glycosyltransferase family 2 protein [Armatimonadota bacterium]
MNVVITMAGFGRRFQEAGYTQPKYEIEVAGRSLLEWSMSSLTDFIGEDHRWIFISRRETNAPQFVRQTMTKLGQHDVEFVELEAPTDGQATTAMEARGHWQADEPMFVFNIDTYVEPGQVRAAQMQGDGCIPCFHAPGNHWSFVRTDGAGRVVEVREKDRISDNCSVGAYYFSSCRLFEDAYKAYFSHEHPELKERYIAPIYGSLLEQGRLVTMTLLDAAKVHALGTPEEVEAFRLQNVSPTP